MNNISNNNESMNNSNKTRIVCPNCGAEFYLPEKTVHAIATLLGQDSNLGVIHPMVVGQAEPSAETPKPMSRAELRIESMRKAGIDVDGRYFAVMKHGESTVQKLVDGEMVDIDDNDEIVRSIRNRGKLYNAHLFKQHVLAQMFKMMTAESYATDEKGKLTYPIQKVRRGYAYHVSNMTWEYVMKMLVEEFHRQAAMKKNGDEKNFILCNLFFNKELAKDVVMFYLKTLVKYISDIKVQKCKGVEYKFINGAQKLKLYRGMVYRGTFCNQIQNDIFEPIHQAITVVSTSNTPQELYSAMQNFMDVFVEIPRTYHKRTRRHKKTEEYVYKYQIPSTWKEAYKGYGAYWSMQNLIEFHGCLIHKDGDILDRVESMEYLNAMAFNHRNDGHWLLGMFNHLLADNHINPEQKMAEWKSAKSRE